MTHLMCKIDFYCHSSSDGSKEETQLQPQLGGSGFSVSTNYQWNLCYLSTETHPQNFLAKAVKIHFTCREKPGFWLSSLTFARLCRSCDDLCPVSGWKSDSLWSGSECSWSELLTPDKFKLNWRGMIQQRKRRGASQLTTLLFLFFVRDSLNVSVKQLRSVGQTQGTSQRLCEEIAPIPHVILNLLLHWREWRWFELPRSWPTVLCQYHGRLMSPARIQGSNTHPANSFTVENHYWNSVTGKNNHLPFCNSRKRHIQLPPLSSSSAYLFKETQL